MCVELQFCYSLINQLTNELILYVEYDCLDVPRMAPIAVDVLIKK